MVFLRVALVLSFVVLAAYTGLVINAHGIGVFEAFSRDIAAVTWPGQFDLDFMLLLAFSGVWVAYRHRFGPRGLALGVCAFVGGVLFLSVYLFVESIRAKGDVTKLLLGDHR